MLKKIYYCFLPHPRLLNNADILCYLNDNKNNNILIANFFEKMDKTPNFIYLYQEGMTRMFNTLIETYAVTRNKKLLYPNQCSPARLPDTVYITLVADRNILTIKNDSNILFFKYLSWTDEIQIDFLKQYLKYNKILYTIPIETYDSRKCLIIFKINFDIINGKDSQRLIDAYLPHDMRTLRIE